MGSGKISCGRKKMRRFYHGGCVSKRSGRLLVAVCLINKTYHKNFRVRGWKRWIPLINSSRHTILIFFFARIQMSNEKPVCPPPLCHSSLHCRVNTTPPALCLSHTHALIICWRLRMQSVISYPRVLIFFSSLGEVKARRFQKCCLKKYRRSFFWCSKLPPDYFATPELCHWKTATRDYGTLLVNIIQILRMVTPNAPPCMHL